MADGKVTIDSELNDKGLEKGLSNMQKKLEGAGKKLQSVGGSLTKNLTLPIVAAGTGALMLASKFDDSMRTVKATMGKNLGDTSKEVEANFKALREEAMLLGATTAHSASDASAAMKELAQMGYDTNQILASTGTVLDVASASGLDLDFVATTLAGSMNQFGVEVDDNGVNIKRFGDVMVRAGQMSGTSMEEIAHALEYVGSAAYNSGMDIEQTSAYIGILGDQSIKGGKAGTALNAMLRDMKGKVKDGNLEFDDFNVAMYDSQGNMRDMTDIMADLEKGLEGKSDAERDAALNAVFGSQAQTAVNAILGEGTEKVRQYEEELKLANDTAKIAAGEMEGGIGGALRGLASATEALAITFGDVLAPVVRRIAQFVANLFLKFTELTEGQKKTVVAVLAVLAAIGPLLTIIGTLIIVISKVVGAFAMLTPPILIAIAAIAAIIAIGVALYKNWETVKEKAIEVFSHFQPLLDTVKASFQKLMDSVGPIIESLKTLWQSLIPLLQKVGAIVGGVVAVAFGILIGVFNGVVAAIGPIINALINFVDFVVNMVNTIVALFTGDFAGAWEYLQAAGQSTIDFFVNLFNGLIDFLVGFVDAVIGFFHGLYMTLVGNSIIPDMVNAIVEWFQNMFQWLIDIVMNIVDAVTNAFKAVFEVISNYLEMAREIIQSIWNYISDTFTNALDFLKALVTGDFQGMKDAIQKQMENAKRLLENIWKAIDKFLTATLGGIWDTIKSIFSNIFSTISSILSSIRSIITSVWNGIRSVITGVVNAIRTVISSVFNAIRSVITTVMNGIRSTISSIWNGIKSMVTSVVNGIKSTVSNIFNSLSGIVRTAFSKVKSAVTSGITGAYNVVKNKVKDFFNAGKNIVGAIADGIKAAVGKVTDAIGNIASKVRNFLPFSPAKDGPLRDLDKLDFGGPIEDSMEDAIPDVQAKMNALLKVPNFQPTGDKKPKPKPDTKNNNDDKPVHIENVMVLDGEVLARATVDPIDTMLSDRVSIESYLKGDR